MKCPYCHRSLKGMGTRCRACRRYVLSWMHYLALAVFGLFVGWVVLELFFRV